MKTYFIVLLIGLITILTSCSEYLDKAPSAAFSEEEVFSNRDNFMKFFDANYKGWRDGATGNKTENNNIVVAYNFYISGGSRQFSIEQMTDFCDQAYPRENQPIKLGTMGNIIEIFYDAVAQRPQVTAMWKLIRTCNLCLRKVDGVKDMEQREKDDIKAQCHFIRAFAHYDMFRFWGPMPYLTKVLGPYDNWDLTRLSKHETCLAIAADCDTAFSYYEKANMMRRDNLVLGGVGHLNDPEMFRPAGMAAKGLKARILLYAASPQNNELGLADWEEAAKANWVAIQVAEQNGVFLLSAANYTQNFIGANYSDEQLFGYAAGAHRYNSSFMSYNINAVWRGSSRTCASAPTQNAADYFETKWGEPLKTQAERDAATLAGHYDEQNPYANRDPRFYVNFIYNQAPVPGYTTANIYYENIGGNPVYTDITNPALGCLSTTGYYERKWWGGQSINNNNNPLYTDPIIRLAEMYLNYAEAANEAYGPNTPAPGATMTAVQAINEVRQRILQPAVLPQYTTTKDVFRERIRNERIVELAFEGHYYFDIRRWLIAPITMAGPMMGMNIEKVPVSTEYPIGFKHTRVPINAAHQCIWKDEMYYFPFKEEDYYKFKNFDLSINPRW